MKIILFSRPIRTGKTTEILRWKERQPSLTGIAMPDAPQGRLMQDIGSGETWQAQCLHPLQLDKTLLTVGRFCFYSAAFERANERLLQKAVDHPNWLAIDEIGKLELKQQGFYSSLIQILKSSRPLNLLLVVRDNLLAEVVNAFELSEAQVVKQLDELP